MRNIILAAALLLAAPGRSAAITIPLIYPSTFSGYVDNKLLGPDLADGYPSGAGTGSITFDGDLVPHSVIQVTALDLSQLFYFLFVCLPGDICPQGAVGLPVALSLEDPSSVTIDSEGHASGELRVRVSAQEENASATLIVNVFGHPLVPGAFTVQGAFQFDNSQSPFVGLQGVTLVPEPSVVVLLTLLMVAVGRRRSSL